MFIFPTNFLIDVFYLCDEKTLVKAKQVCKKWHTLLTDDWGYALIARKILREFTIQSSFKKSIPFYLQIKQVQTLLLGETHTIDENRRKNGELINFLFTLPKNFSLWVEGQNRDSDSFFNELNDNNKILTGGKADTGSKSLTCSEDDSILFLDTIGNRIVSGSQSGRISLFSLDAQETAIQAFDAYNDLESEDEEDSLLNFAQVFDNKITLLFSFKILKIYDLTTFKCILDKELERSFKYIEVVEAGIVAFTWDGDIQVLDSKNGDVLLTLKRSELIVCSKIIKEKLIVGTKSDFVEIWDIKTGMFLKKLPGHTESLRGLEIFDEDKIISYSSTAEKRTIVKIWDIISGSLLMQTTIPKEISAIGVQGRKIVLSNHEDVSVWDFETGILT